MRNTQVNSNGVGVNRVPPGGKGIAQHTPTRTLADYAGREAQIAGFGEQIVGFKDPEILTIFAYFINPEHVKTSDSTGAWSATVNESRMQVTAGTGAVAGDAIIDSRQVIGYRPGFDSYGLLTAAFDVYKEGTTQDFGPHDDLNGFAIGLEPNNEIAVKHFSNGVLVSNTPQSKFLLDPLDSTGLSGFTLNPQALNVYRFTYGYLGVMPASIEIYAGPEIGWIAFHFVDVTGQSNALIIQDPYLPLRFRVTSDGTNEASMFTGSWQGGVIGTPRQRFLNDQFSTDHEVLAAASGGVNLPILTIRNDATFKTKVNKITADLDTLTARVEGNKGHLLRLIKNATTLTGAAFGSVDANSTVSFDITATAMTGGQLKRSWPMGKIDSLGAGAIFKTGEIRLWPGDTVTVALFSTSVATDIGAALHWDELK